MSVNTAYPAKAAEKGDPVALPGLARALVQHQMLRIDQAVALQQKAQAAEQGSFVDELIASKSITAPRLARFLSETFGMPMMDLLALDASVLPTELIDRKLLAETQIVPLLKRGNRLSVLLSDPTDQAALDRVKFQQQATIDAIVVEHDKLRRLLDKLGQSAADKLSDMVGDALDIEMTNDDQAASVVEDSSEVDDAPVVKFLQKILIDAIQPAPPTSTSSRTRSSTGSATAIDGDAARDRAAAARDQGQARLAHQGDLAARHLGEARAAGRPHEAGAVARPGRSTSAYRRCRRCSARRS